MAAPAKDLTDRESATVAAEKDDTLKGGYAPDIAEHPDLPQQLRDDSAAFVDKVIKQLDGKQLAAPEANRLISAVRGCKI